MTTRPTALLLTLALGLACDLPARGQDRPRREPPTEMKVPGEGTELFRGLFAYRGISPVVMGNLGDPSSLIVVLLGLPANTDLWANVVRRTLSAGGSVLIADEGKAILDRRYFPDRSRVELTGQRVRCDDPAKTFAGLPDCPLIVPRVPDAIDMMRWRVENRSPGPEWLLFPMWPRVATNRPGVIRVHAYGPSARFALAGYPATSTTEDDAPLPDSRHFAVGATGVGDQPPFRSLILADPSVFSNQMFAGTANAPTDNMLFAHAVVGWLHADGTRKRCLFVEAGRVRDRFDDVRYAEISPPLPPLPMPPLPSPLDPELQRRLTDGANRVVAGFQDNDVVNRALTGGPYDDHRFSSTMRTLAVLASVFAGFWLIRRVWNGRHEPNMPPVPKDTGRVAASGAPGSFARRREEILQAGNYTEPVREYLRELFLARGLVLPDGADPPRKLPAIEATGRDAGAIRGHLRILWDVAYTTKSRPVTYSRWKELEPMIDVVRRAADDGRWRFAAEGHS